MSTRTLTIIIIIFLLLAAGIFIVSRQPDKGAQNEFAPSALHLQNTDIDDGSASQAGQTSTVATGACVPKGCHKELCVDEGVMVKDSCATDPYQLLVESCTTQYARCERQATGACGWTQTETYNQCMIEISEK